MMGTLVAGVVLARLVLSPAISNSGLPGVPSVVPFSSPGPEMAATAESTRGRIATPSISTTAPVTAIPLPASAWRPSAIPADADLKALIGKMSLQDKVAQILMVGFSGQSVADSPELTSLIGTYHVGGVVLLEANAHDPQQLSALTHGLQSLATSTGACIPVFTAINHEGGTVVRITEGATGFPGNMAVAATGRTEYAYVSAALAAQELRAMGINMNLAPVLDVNDNPYNPVIGARSFGADPALVVELGRLAVRGSQENGVIAVAKHFPGHGSVSADSHELLPRLDAPLEKLWQRELPPFQAAIQEHVGGIMTAHLNVPALDASGRPATLSRKVLTDLLRQQMGYDGLIMTDSLGMGAISANRGQAQAAVEAVQAGADVVLSTSPMSAHIAIIQQLADAVRQGKLSAERIDQSVLRILRFKYAYGLFEPSAPFDAQRVGTPGHQAVANEIARQAVTLMRNDARQIPLPPPPARLLVISPNTLPPAASSKGTLFGELLRGQGYRVTELVLNLDSPLNRTQVYASATAQASTHDLIIFGEWELIKRYVNSNDTWQERLIADLGKSGCPLIVVAWHNPAAILRCPQVSTFLTAYDNTRAQVAAVVAVLVGSQLPAGHLPMPLPK